MSREYDGSLRAARVTIIGGILQPLEWGQKVTKMEFTYDGDGDLNTIVFKDGDTTLFTVTCGYDGSKRLTSLTRS